MKMFSFNNKGKFIKYSYKNKEVLSKNRKDDYFMDDTRYQYMKEKIKLRLLCHCAEKIQVSDVDFFGWYKCSNCNGHMHLKDYCKIIKILLN